MAAALFTGLTAGQAVHPTRLRKHRHHYAAEQRWPERPFRQRRHIPTPHEETSA